MTQDLHHSVNVETLDSYLLFIKGNKEFTNVSDSGTSLLLDDFLKHYLSNTLEVYIDQLKFSGSIAILSNIKYFLLENITSFTSHIELYKSIVMALEILFQKLYKLIEIKPKNDTAIEFFPDIESHEHVGLGIDVGTKIRVEQRLKESLYFIEQIADTNPNFIIVYDMLNHRIVYCNKAIEELLGINKVQLKSDNQILKKIIHPDDFPKILIRHERLKNARDGEILDLEYRIKSYTGKWHWILTRAVIFKRNLRDEAWQILVTSQDINENKEAEETLRQLNESLKHAVEGIALVDVNGKYVTLNKAKANILGYYSDELIDKDWKSSFYKEDIALAEDAFQKMKAEGKVNFEARGLKKDGSIFYKEVTLVSNIDNYGIYKGFYCFIRDISERKKAEAELKKNEALLAEAQRIAHLGSWEWDLKTGSFVFSNELCRIFGYEHDDKIFCFENFLGYIHPDDVQSVRTIFTSSMLTGEPFSLEYKILRPDKQVRTILTKGIIIVDHHGNTVKASGTGLDITDIKETENKLRLSESLLIEAQELARLGNWELDLLTGKIHLSDEMYRLYGLKPKEIQFDKKVLMTFLPEDAVKTLEETKLKILKTFKPSHYEHRIILPNKKVRTIYGQAKPVFNSKGDIVKISGYSQDITERKEGEMMLKQAYEEIKLAEEQLIQLNLELEQKVKERTEELLYKNQKLQENNVELLRINTDLDNFIYTASHDLKAPISNIEGLVSALSTEISTESEDVRLMIDMVFVSISRFKETIKDLTEITKVQKNFERELEIINISELICEIKTDIKNLIEESGAIVCEHFDAQEIKFSRKNLRSIFYNLVSNAIKYKSPERSPVVHISSYYEKESIVISVKDNGLGICEENINKIFSMFTRMHDHVEGTGIGLYIVKRIVDNSGGKIVLESTPDIGSEFKIYLPNAFIPNSQ